ncbi:autotransporter-associated beta strand repeat-containing protein, partial [Methylobacterium sp. E-065]|nr:autotransporter-associated beta strand repeat-containing protein [Methylobacterium sp. E-065]
MTTATSLGDRQTYGWGLLNLGKAIDGPGQFTRNWTVDTTYSGQAYYGTFANDISGIGGLTKVGAGTLELAGDNTYAGGNKVYGGTLAVSRDRNLGADGTGLTLGGGGRLRVLADGFSTAHPVTLDGHGGLRIDIGSSTFAGVIADGFEPGFLLKDGSGTAVLTAANTLTGGTTVEAGTLALTATGRLVSPVSIGPDGRPGEHRTHQPDQGRIRHAQAHRPRTLLGPDHDPGRHTLARRVLGLAR